jgi:hypothetical protein
MERKTKIGDLAKMAKETGSKVQGWLVVLARCFQLQDAIAVLELDRVLDAAPDDLDNGHRLGLKASRQKRLDTISRSTGRLLARMDAAAGTANTKVLLHPATSPAVVQSREHAASVVADFHGLSEPSTRRTKQAHWLICVRFSETDSRLMFQRGVRTSNPLPSGSARHVHETSPWPRSMPAAPRARSRATSAA